VFSTVGNTISQTLEMAGLGVGLLYAFSALAVTALIVWVSLFRDPYVVYRKYGIHVFALYLFWAARSVLRGVAGLSSLLLFVELLGRLLHHDLSYAMDLLVVREMWHVLIAALYILVVVGYLLDKDKNTPIDLRLTKHTMPELKGHSL